MEYEISYTARTDGIIEETTNIKSYPYRTPAEINKGFLDTKDKGFRQALIKLGWTPPKGSVKRIGLLIVHPGLSAGDLKGLEWDEVWIHPDVKYGVAKEILNINPKAKQVVW